MKKITSLADVEGLPFGTPVDFGELEPGYFSNQGTVNGKRWGQRVYWTVTPQKDCIVERAYTFGSKGPELCDTVIHDKGTSGDYTRLESWLSGVTAQAA